MPDEGWDLIIDGWIDQLVDLHKEIGVLLGKLPIPVQLPPINGEEDELFQALMEMDRCRVILWSEPLPQERKAALDNLLLDWLLARELIAALHRFGPAGYRVDGIQRSIGMCWSVLHLLQVEFDQPDEPSKE